MTASTMKLGLLLPNQGVVFGATTVTEPCFLSDAPGQFAGGKKTQFGDSHEDFNRLNVLRTGTREPWWS